MIRFLSALLQSYSSCVTSQSAILRLAQQFEEQANDDVGFLTLNSIVGALLQEEVTRSSHKHMVRTMRFIQPGIQAKILKGEMAKVHLVRVEQVLQLEDLGLHPNETEIAGGVDSEPLGERL